MIWGTIIEKKFGLFLGKISESVLVPRLKRSKNLDHKQRNYSTETLLLFTRLQAFSYGRGKGGGNLGVNEVGTWVSKMTGAFRRVVKSFRRLCSTLQKETKHQKVGTTFEVAKTGSEIVKFSFQPPSPGPYGVKLLSFSYHTKDLNRRPNLWRISCFTACMQPVSRFDRIGYYFEMYLEMSWLSETNPHELHISHVLRFLSTRLASCGMFCKRRCSIHKIKWFLVTMFCAKYSITELKVISVTCNICLICEHVLITSD